MDTSTPQGIVTKNLTCLIFCAHHMHYTHVQVTLQEVHETAQQICREQKTDSDHEGNTADS